MRAAPPRSRASGRTRERGKPQAASAVSASASAPSSSTSRRVAADALLDRRERAERPAAAGLPGRPTVSVSERHGVPAMSIVARPSVAGHARAAASGTSPAWLDDVVAVGDLRERAAAAQQRLAAVAGRGRSASPGAAQDRARRGRAARRRPGCGPSRSTAASSSAPASSPQTPTAATAASAIRARRLPRQPHGRSAQPTPRTVWRMRGSPAALELAAQVADEDVDHVGLDVGRVAPHQREQLVAREHLAGVADEDLEQVELAAGEAELAAAARGDVAARVDDEVAAPRAGRRPSAPRRRSSASQPRGQLVDRERLDQVVVGAGLQAGDAVVDLVARGQHADGRVDARRCAAA